MSTWSDLDDIVIGVVEQHLDGEPIRIIPRIAGEFSGYIPDPSRPEYDIIATFSDTNSIRQTSGESSEFSGTARVFLSKARMLVSKRNFGGASEWPQKNDAVVRDRTGERLCISIVSDNGQGLDIFLVED
jgi:hypothetical protein